jgi:hypothetical protein
MFLKLLKKVLTMKSRLSKSIGFTGLLSISIFLAISLNLQIAKYKGSPVLANLAMGQVTSQIPPSSFIHLYVLVAEQNDKETIVFQNDACNFPEVAPVSLILQDWVLSAVTGNLIEKRLYTGSDSLTVDVKIPDIFTGSDAISYKLLDLTNSVPLINYPSKIPDPSDPTKEIDDLNWYGFYFAKGDNNNLTNAVSACNVGPGYGAGSTYSHMIPVSTPNKISLTFNGTVNKAVVGVVSWCWSKNLTIPLWIVCTSDLGTQGVLPIPWTLCINTNVDNVDLERVMIRQNYKGNIPPPTAGYTGDPGVFAVRLTNAVLCGETGLYHYIEHILYSWQKNIKKGNHHWTPVSGNGPDWLQVAAADIYNFYGSTHNVFKCVWKIVARDLGKPELVGLSGGGREPYSVALEPWHAGMRFNMAGFVSYDMFHSQHLRWGIIIHEALHCYHNLAGVNVYDKESLSVPTPSRYGDYLYVSTQDTPGSENGYLRYSYDSKRGGYIRPDSRYSSVVWQYSHPLYGDSVKNAANGDGVSTGEWAMQADAKFTEKQKRLFLGDLNNNDARFPIEIETDIPKFMPEFKSGVKITKIYLYNMDPNYDDKGDTKNREILLCNDPYNINVGRTTVHREGWIEVFSKNTMPGDSGHLNGDDGYYIPKTYCFRIWRYPNSYGTPGCNSYDKFKMIVRNWAKWEGKAYTGKFNHPEYVLLCVIYQAQYNCPSREYDASHFGYIKAGENTDPL